MNKIRVIDLLNKMANDEELPNKVKIKNYDYIFTLRADCNGYKWYVDETTYDDFGELIHENLEFALKQEIEIIEEDKPIEKISEIKKTLDVAFLNLEDALDKINRLENELEKENE